MQTRKGQSQSGCRPGALCGGGFGERGMGREWREENGVILVCAVRVRGACGACGAFWFVWEERRNAISTVCTDP